MAAAKSKWTIIPAKIKDHLMYNTKGKLTAPNHVYSVQSASPNRLTAYNPWGSSHIKNMSRDQFKAVFHHLFFNKP
jgi:hypothetical protein